MNNAVFVLVMAAVGYLVGEDPTISELVPSAILAGAIAIALAAVSNE